MSRLSIIQCAACLSSNNFEFQRTKDHSISGELFHIYECRDCGFRFTQDPPVEEDCGPYYQSEDYISHSDSEEGWMFKVYHKVRQIMLDRKFQLIKKFETPATLLDVGSGTGYFLDYMLHKGYQVTGIEVDQKAREYSRSKFGVDVYSPNDLLSENIKGPFGIISLWHVLEHLYQPDHYWQRFHQLLDDRGKLIIAVPNHKSHDATKYKDYWAAYDVPRHLWHFHPGALKIMAERNGFELVHTEGMPFDPFYNSLLSEKYLGSKVGMFKAGWTGLISLIKGYRNVNKASSVIYVLKKKG